MYFINRGYNGFWILAVLLLGIFLLFQFLPLILLAVAVWAAVRYGLKFFKTWNFNKDSKAERVSKSDYGNKKEEEYSFNSSNVIDVEYTEVK